MLSRLLLLQSHVVSGCVGNRAAVFPLQLLGFDVDFINSVQFSVHTGYRPGERPKGTITTGDELREIVAGLEMNGVLDYDYFLTGYIASESFLDEVLGLLSKLKAINPNVKYICDPVCGDDGKLYIPRQLVDIFIQKVIPNAYMITPNQFEAELLTGIKIRNHEDAVNALICLHKMGPKVVVLTSSELIGEEDGDIGDSVEGIDNTSTGERNTEMKGNKLCCFSLSPVEDVASSSSSPTSTDKYVSITKIVVEKKKGYFTGTGDATAALLLAWIHILGINRCGDALENTLGTMQAVIDRTSKRQKDLTHAALELAKQNADKEEQQGGEVSLTTSQKSRLVR